MASGDFISAPVFPGDEDKTIAAAMAHYGILFGLVANLVHIPILFLAGDSVARSLVLPFAVIAGLLLNHRFLQLGYVRSSSAVFLVVAWALLAGANYHRGRGGGPRVSRPTSSSSSARVSSSVGGGRSSPPGVSSLLGVVFMVLEQEGRLPPLQVNNTPARHAILLSATFFIVAAILSIMVRRLRATIADGQTGTARPAAGRAAAGATPGRPRGDGPGAHADPRADERRVAQGGRRPPPRRGSAAAGEGVHRPR